MIDRMWKFMAVGFVFWLALMLPSVMADEYTPFTHDDGQGHIAIYSEPKFVYEDGLWKEAKDADRLDDKMWNGHPLFEIIKLEDDPRYEIEVEEFDYYCAKKIKVKSNYGETATIPVKVNNFLDQEILINDGQEIEIEDICFYPSIFGNNITFGFNSTTLEFGDSENQIDGRAYDGSANYHLQVRWDISSIPASQKIDGATLALYSFETYNDGSCDDDVNASRVDDQDWTVSISAANYAAQVTTNETVQQTNGTAPSAGAGVDAGSFWFAFNVTNIIKTDYDAGNVNSTIRVEDPDYRLASISSLVWTSGDLLTGAWNPCYLKIAPEEDSENSANPVLYINYSAAGGGGASNNAYLIDLHINGSYANYSGTFPQHFNITAWSNSSEVPITLYKNGTVIGNATGNITNYTTTDWFNASGWNITAAWVGNSSDDYNATSLFITLGTASLSTVNDLRNGSGTFGNGLYPALYNFTMDNNNAVLASDCVYGLKRAGTTLSSNAGSFEFEYRPAGTAAINWTMYWDTCENYTSSAQYGAVYEHNFGITQGSSYDRPTLFMNDEENGNITLINNSQLNATCFMSGDNAIVPANYEPIQLNMTVTGWEVAQGDTPTYENVTTIYTDTLGDYQVECFFPENENYTATGDQNNRTVLLTLTDYTLINFSYNPNVLVGANEEFWINLTLPATASSLVEAYIVWNGTNYTYDSVSNHTPDGNRQIVSFNRTHTIPSIVNYNENVSIGFNAIYQLSDGTQAVYNASERFQQIWKPFAGAWNSSMGKIMNFTFANETTDFEGQNATMNAYLYFYLGASIYETNFSITNTSVQIGVFPAWYNGTIYGNLYYDDNETTGISYQQREYSFQARPVDNVTDEYVLYMIGDPEGTRIDLSIKDEYNSPYGGVIVEVQRWYPSLATYYTVASMETDQQGSTNTYLYLYDVQYRFIIKKNDVTLSTFERQYITETDITLVIDPEVIVWWLQMEFNKRLDGDCSYSETTGNLSCWYKDRTYYELLESANLRVREIGAFRNSQICNIANSTTPDGTFFCHIGNATNKIFEYEIVGNLTYGRPYIWVIQKGLVEGGQLDTRLFGNCGSLDRVAQCNEGLIIAFFMVLVGALLALWNPLTSIMFMSAMMVVTWNVGLVAITLYQLASGLVVGVVIMIVVGRKK